ncbi:uncharacterized protein LOC134458216 [Engraulis encrasicolus]|uniref:uncharacterized protein LOC134458216 n=1 Tax=Engraulis encrasicolus TaxID=184585 RepID=UPI002FCED41A
MQLNGREERSRTVHYRNWHPLLNQQQPIMSELLDEDSVSDGCSDDVSTISLISEAPSQPLTLSGESNSGASSPRPISEGPNKPTSECLSQEDWSREADISASSSASSVSAGPSQVPQLRLPSARALPPRGVKSWTRPGARDDSRAADSNACLGDATSLADDEGDDDDEIWNAIRGITTVDNAGDCHLSDASSSTEFNQDPDEGSSNRFDLNDDYSLLAAFSDPRLRRNLRKPTTTAKGIDNASLRPVRKVMVLVPTCWNEPADSQETSEEEDCAASTDHDSPVLDISAADASADSPQQQTPTQQLLQDQAVVEEDAAERGSGSVASVEEGTQECEKGVCCPFLRRLGKNLRSLGRRSRKVEPLSIPQAMQETKETPREETSDLDKTEELVRQELREELGVVEQEDGQKPQGICAFFRRLGGMVKRRRKQNAANRKGLRRILFSACCCYK